MSLTNSLCGSQGTMTVNSTFLPITSWSADLNISMADSTDSNTYDPATGRTWTTKAFGAQGIEVTAEGNFDLSTTDAAIVQILKSGNIIVNVTLGINRSTNFCVSSPFNLESCSIKVSVPGATMVTFSCKLSSQGAPTLP